jgi:hypothetical protein
MVVCDGALVLNLMASVMMNGVCCIHVMEEEERRKKEQREALRKVVEVEWQRQRLMEQEQYQQFLKEKGLDAGSLLADERRKRLIATKVLASQHSSSALSDALSSTSSSQSQYLGEEHAFLFRNMSNEFEAQSERDDEQQQQQQRSLPASPNSPRCELREHDRAIENTIKWTSRSRSAPQSRARHRSLGTVPLLVGASSGMNNSLMDTDSDDDFDDDEAYVELSLK